MLFAFVFLIGFSGSMQSCETFIQSSSNEYRIPPQLLSAISLVESGRSIGQKRVAWPWTINANGQSFWFSNKEEAIQAVLNARKKGIKSIDVGCMQVNLKHHPHAFKSLEEAFDPQSNVAYAAKFLSQLFQKWQSWIQAIACYHSSSILGHQYLQRVLKAWGKPYWKSSPSITPSTRVVRRIIPLR